MIKFDNFSWFFKDFKQKMQGLHKIDHNSRKKVKTQGWKTQNSSKKLKVSARSKTRFAENRSKKRLIYGYPVSNQIMKKITREEVFRQKKFHCYDILSFSSRKLLSINGRLLEKKGVKPSCKLLVVHLIMTFWVELHGSERPTIPSARLGFLHLNRDKISPFFFGLVFL